MLINHNIVEELLKELITSSTIIYLFCFFISVLHTCLNNT